MKAMAVTFAMSAMLTVDQYDLNRQWLDGPSSAVSADGRYVAFTTYARLTSADSDNAGDVYVLDRIQQRVTFESPDVAGRIDCFHAGISGDGRYVVFEADGSVVWRDRLENATRIAARGRQPSIAENGHTIVFTSNHDVYSLDVGSGESHRVSIDLPGLNPARAASANPSVSADGRYVSFSAKPPFDTRRSPAAQPDSHVFVRDTVLNVTRHIGTGWAPSLSGDGRYVAFVGSVSGLSHIFLADVQTNTTRVITKSVRRGRANGSSANPGTSADGRFVVFQSQASDLVRDEDFNLLWDVFVYDRTSETVTRVSGDPDDMWMEPSVGPSIDGTGSVIAFSSRHPTGAADKRNDFDLYVAAIHTSTTRAALSTEDQKARR